MTRVPSTLIDVNLALRTHETLWTLTTVSRHEVAAGCSIVARVGGAGVRFMLTVGAPVAVDTVTAVGEPGVPAGSSVPAEAGHRGALLVGGNLTGDLPDIADLARPTRWTGAEE